jgi:hypothetical protein
MNVSIKAVIDVNGTVSKIEDPSFWSYAASEYHRLLSPYVPFETGSLDNTVRYNAGKTTGEIEYYAPYAHYIYEGQAMGPSYYSEGYGFWSPPGRPKQYTGKPLAISRSKHPKASAHWDEVAEPTQVPKLIQALQAYVDSGRLNFE